MAKFEIRIKTTEPSAYSGGINIVMCQECGRLVRKNEKYLIERNEAGKTEAAYCNQTPKCAFNRMIKANWPTMDVDEEHTKILFALVKESVERSSV
jgi:hypothetical protein